MTKMAMNFFKMISSFIFGTKDIAPEIKDIKKDIQDSKDISVVTIPQPADIKVDSQEIEDSKDAITSYFDAKFYDEQYIRIMAIRYGTTMQSIEEAIFYLQGLEMNGKKYKDLSIRIALLQFYGKRTQDNKNIEKYAKKIERKYNRDCESQEYIQTMKLYIKEFRESILDKKLQESFDILLDNGTVDDIAIWHGITARQAYNYKNRLMDLFKQYYSIR